MAKLINRTNVVNDDCVLKGMMGKFDLAFFASRRAKAISLGSPTSIEGFDDPIQHSTIVALEEFRQGKVVFSDLVNSLSVPLANQVSTELDALDDIKQSDVKDLVGNTGYNDFEISEEDQNTEEENS